MLTKPLEGFLQFQGQSEKFLKFPEPPKSFLTFEGPLKFPNSAESDLKFQVTRKLPKLLKNFLKFQVSSESLPDFFKL